MLKKWHVEHDMQVQLLICQKGCGFLTVYPLIKYSSQLRFFSCCFFLHGLLTTSIRQKLMSIVFCHEQHILLGMTCLKFLMSLDVPKFEKWELKCLKIAVTWWWLILCLIRLSELGQQVGSRVLDVLVLREKGMKREIKVLNILLFVKSVLWKVGAIDE